MVRVKKEAKRGALCAGRHGKMTNKTTWGSPAHDHEHIGNDATISWPDSFQPHALRLAIRVDRGRSGLGPSWVFMDSITRNSRLSWPRKGRRDGFQQTR